MDSKTQFRQILRNNGERITKPRLISFDILSSHAPLSSVELVSMLKEQGINPATTYRNISMFKKLGIVNDIVSGGKRLIELGDEVDAHHHHFYCINCGKLQDFDSSSIDNVIKDIGVDLDVEVLTHQLELSGLCSECRTKNS